MRKPTVDRILVKGSPKQRILLYIEGVIAETYGQSPLLSAVELHRLNESFKSDYEIEVFNKAMGYFRAIIGYLAHIEAVRNEYQSRIHILRGVCQLWIVYIRQEETYNKILFSAQDKATKELIREIILDRWILWADAKTDIEGFIEIVTDKNKKVITPNKDLNLIEEEEIAGINLQKVITLLSNQTKEELIRVKTMISVVISFMEKTYDVRGFRNLLKDFERPFYDNQAPLPIFNRRFWAGEHNAAGEPLSEDVAQFLKEFRESTFKDKEEIYSKYWVFSNYAELEIDQEFFDEQYENFFKPVE